MCKCVKLPGIKIQSVHKPVPLFIVFYTGLFSIQQFSILSIVK